MAARRSRPGHGTGSGVLRCVSRCSLRAIILLASRDRASPSPRSPSAHASPSRLPPREANPAPEDSVAAIRALRRGQGEVKRSLPAASNGGTASRPRLVGSSRYITSSPPPPESRWLNANALRAPSAHPERPPPRLSALPRRRGGAFRRRIVPLDQGRHAHKQAIDRACCQ